MGEMGQRQNVGRLSKYNMNRGEAQAEMWNNLVKKLIVLDKWCTVLYSI